MSENTVSQVVFVNTTFDDGLTEEQRWAQLGRVMTCIESDPETGAILKIEDFPLPARRPYPGPAG